MPHGVKKTDFILLVCFIENVRSTGLLIYDCYNWQRYLTISRRGDPRALYPIPRRNLFPANPTW
jgi:hypothetical protein